MNLTGEKTHGKSGCGSRKYSCLSGWSGIFLLLFMLLPTAAFSAADVIVDNQDAGFSQDRPERWNVEDKAQAYAGNHRYSSHDNPDDTYFTPDLPGSGYYSVYIRWVEASNRDYQVQYRVYYNKGKDNYTRVINQRTGGGEWFLIINPSRADGKFYFEGNTDKEKIRMRMGNTSDGFSISADAVRFSLEPLITTTTTTTTITTTTTTTTTTLPLGSCEVDPNGTIVEAEHEVTSGDNFSDQGTYIRGLFTNYGGASGTSFEYTMDFPVAGTYYLWVRGRASSGSNNSAWYGSDGIPEGNITVNTTDNNWYWVNTRHDAGPDPLSITIGSTGTHTINFWSREINFDIDSFAITQNSGPLGSGYKTLDPTTCASAPTTTTTTTSTTTTTVTGPTTTTTSTTTTTLPWTPGLCSGEPLADLPLDAMLQPAPAILMFALDDSGSMDWEFMTSESDGVFKGEYYVFNNPGDNLPYGSSYILSGSGRDYWRARWSGYNFMYYNPGETYRPWPVISGVTGIQAPANLDTPRSHPRHSSPTFNLSAIYDTIAGVNIARSHFFDYVDTNGNETLDAGEPVYLANIVSSTLSVDYYLVTEDGSGRITALTPVASAGIPAAFPTDYEMVRQNFANWYSFYRRRELTATAAVSNVIIGLEGVQVGIRSINGRIVQPVMQIKIGTTDQTADLLNVLYSMVLQAQGTPLRRGLQYVGQYLHQDDGKNGGGLGNSPYASAADGGACQQAFTIVMTDGYYNGSSPDVGNVDGNNGAPYADNWSNTLADVAMYYYENDLSSSLDPVVPTKELDTNPEQHMVTYGVSFGVVGTLDPNDYNLEDGPLPNWPDPFNGTDDNANRIDDLWHASVNGRGIFLSARNPIELVESLRAVMQNIASREGSAASVSINGDELNEEVSGEIRMYQTIYRSDGWRGDLKSFLIDITTGRPDTDDPVWSASEQMTGLIGEDGSNHWRRLIATYDSEDIYSTASGVGIPFTWTGYMEATTSQWTLLDPLAAAAEDILDYIRGDRGNEVQNGGSLRNRFSGEGDSVLGDFIHSRPLYYEDRISTPSSGVDDCIGDSVGEDSLACLLFVGGNDGMLHAFNALTGNEMFSYIPGLVFENIRELTEPLYAHRYFVDNTAYIKKFSSKSILVSGLGKGGRGVFALDVKDPETINTEAALSSRVMWEYPAPGTTDPDMGFSFSESFIVKTNDSRINNGTEFEGYVMLFGNGYSSPDGQAALYILNPLTGGKLLSSDGGIRKIYGGVSATCNGLSTPAPVDDNIDGTVDYVYAGDLLGNLWKFNLTSDDHTQWSVAYTDSGVSKPLFTASADRSSGSSGVQAITTKPDVMYQCGLEKGHMVIFGTGKYLESSDVSDTTLESIYAVWDYGDDEDKTEFLGRFDTGSTQNLSNQASNVTLLEQTAIFDGMVDVDGDGDLDDHYRVMSNNQIKLWTENDATPSQDPNPGPGSRGSNGVDDDNDGQTDEADEKVAHAGWFFDLPIEKEKVVTNLLIRDNKAIVISFTPTESSCRGRGGSSIIHEIDACSGGRVGTWVSATELVNDINGDGIIDVSDYDLDGDGVIDESEFYIDMNGDGTLDINDFNILDINGDGEISASEFFTLDTNGDGIIDEYDQVFIEEPVFDITGDNLINRDDYIDIPVYDPVSGGIIQISVPVSGRRKEGMLHPPPILRLDDIEKKYMSSSTGLIEIVTEPAERRGMSYWKKIK